MPAEAVRERQSECTVCPPFVMACAHYDGRVVVMLEPAAGTGEICPGCDFKLFNQLLWSVHGPDSKLDCLSTPSREEAESDLARRAELLRLGEPDRA